VLGLPIEYGSTGAISCWFGLLRSVHNRTMSRTARRENYRLFRREDKARRRAWTRKARAEARTALRRSDEEAAANVPRRTEGWLTI